MAPFDTNYLSLTRCPICGGERGASSNGLIGNVKTLVVTFNCGLIVAPDAILAHCPNANAYAWRRALADLQVARYGSVGELNTTEVIRRSEELVAYVERDRQKLIEGAAHLIWRNEVLDGIAAGRHHPRECPTTRRRATWNDWPCPDCAPCMGDTMPETMRAEYEQRAASETHLEFELASAIVRLLEIVRARVP